MTDPVASSTEHRFLTVMFCDMEDSSGQLFRLGPEAYENVLTAYRQIVFEQIRRHGGYVVHVIGDGIVATFGWPRAGGRDVQSAVTCALVIGTELERLHEMEATELPACPAARMAIETGWVLVGEIGPRDQAEHDGLIGQALNIAARLQQLAHRNGVVVGEGALALLRDNFITDSVDTTGLKLPAPVRAAHVLGPANNEHPLGRLHALARTPLVGREAEMRALRGAWDAATAANGRVVLLSGEAGMGKSRLLTGFCEVLAASGVPILLLFCAEPMADTPFHPLVAPLSRAAGVSLTATPGEIAARMAELAVELGLPPRQAGAALTTLLGAPLRETSPSATDIRRWTFDALLAWIDSLCARSPLLVVVEDIHPYSGALYIFRGRRGDLIKILFWDRQGRRWRHSGSLQQGSRTRSKTR